MGVDLWFSAIPVNLTYQARDLVERSERASVDLVCLVAYRARLNSPHCLASFDLARAPAIRDWLIEARVRAGVELSAVRARLREALETIGDWPRDLGVFVDPVAERRWLVSGGVTSGDAPTSVCYELDLVAESGICDLAVSIVEAEAALRALGCEVPEQRTRPVVPPWSGRDDALAAREGWGLFTTGRDPYLEVQCLDVPDPGEGELSDDLQAWMCVLDGILRGSATHARAFGQLLVNAPVEALALVQHWSEHVNDVEHDHPSRAPAPPPPATVRRRPPPSRPPGLGH